MALAEVMANDPDVTEILLGVDKKMLATALMEGILGFDLDEDDE